MTLAVKLWIVDGQNNLPANIARLMLRSATRNGNGIVEAADLRVNALTVPGTAVVVGDGACIARGEEETWQGSYWAYNVGDEQVDLTPVGSSGPRSDLVYLRIEDPGLSAVTWDHNPDTDPKAYFRVQENVSANTVDIPAGKTGIPLALVTRPANTATVLQEHITSLRQMADARTKTVVLEKQGQWGVDPPDNQNFTDAVGGNINYTDWPHDASFPLDVPDWASSAKVIFSWGQVQYIKGGSGNMNADGSVRILVGSQATDDMRYLTGSGTPNLNRMSITGADTIDIPAAMRGTTVNVQMQGKATANSAGTDRATTGLVQCDGGSSVYVMVVFEEVPT